MNNIICPSYKVGVKTSPDEDWMFINKLRFDSHQSAIEYAGDLCVRFHFEVEVQVFPSDDPPNCFRKKVA